MSILTMRSRSPLAQFGESIFMLKRRLNEWESQARGLLAVKFGWARARLGKRKMLYKIRDAAFGCLILAFVGLLPLLDAETDAMLLDACEARYYSCEGFRVILINIESALISLDRWHGDSRESRERDLRALRTRKGIDV